MGRVCELQEKTGALYETIVDMNGKFTCNAFPVDQAVWIVEVIIHQ
jgi:hypothetical protein